MRISTSQLQQQGTNAILDAQSRLARVQRQLSTGQRLLSPADDPVAAVRVLGLTRELEAAQRFQANGDLAASRLSLEDDALGGVSSLLQRVRELAVQARSDTLNADNRQAIAQEVRTRLEELLGLANTRDANGEYLFAGFQSETRPFTQDGPGRFTYHGDQGSRGLQVGPSLRVPSGDPGSAVFMDIASGVRVRPLPANTGSAQVRDIQVLGGAGLPLAGPPASGPLTLTYDAANQRFDIQDDPFGEGPLTFSPAVDGLGKTFDLLQGELRFTVSGTPADGDTFVLADDSRHMFGILDDFADALEDDTGSDTSLAAIDAALGRVLEVRSQVGARLNAVDSQQDVTDAFSLQLQQTLSETRDLDIVSAVSEMNLHLTALQTAQQSFVRVQGLSLFDFL